MKFHGLKITDLRAIRRFEINDLGSFVVVAGQNGSGKSCVFDAIRLLKSVYGGYSANEYHQWFGEFQIDLQDPSSLRKLFRSVAEPIQIEASVSFSPEEKEYLSQNVHSLAPANRMAGSNWSASTLESEEWLKTFPGRRVLHRFTSKYPSAKTDSQVFSNLVLDKMAERSLKPEPMKVILDKIAGV